MRNIFNSLSFFYGGPASARAAVRIAEAISCFLRWAGCWLVACDADSAGSQQTPHSVRDILEMNDVPRDEGDDPSTYRYFLSVKLPN